MFGNYNYTVEELLTWPGRNKLSLRTERIAHAALNHV